MCDSKIMRLERYVMAGGPAQAQKPQQKPNKEQMAKIAAAQQAQKAKGGKANPISARKG